VRSDAYRALLRRDERFDVIVSEPSNPWAAGIEMLFSREFLRAARDRLAPGGVYVQWYHLYENSERSVELVLQTYAEVFDQVAIWRSQSTDLLLIGLRGGDGAVDLARVERRAAEPDFRAELAEIGIDSLPQLLVHEAVPFGVLHARGPIGLPPHTLYHPRLSYEAGRGFFVGDPARLPILCAGRAARVGAQSSLLRRYLSRFEGEPPDAVWTAMIDRACSVGLASCPTLVAAWSQTRSPEALQQRLADLRSRFGRGARLDLVPLMRFFYAAPGSEMNAGPPEDIAGSLSAYFQRYVHAMPFPRSSVVALWQHCEQDGVYGPRCQQGLRSAERFVRTGELPDAWSNAGAQ
jgi:hypothetical protein